MFRTLFYIVFPVGDRVAGDRAKLVITPLVVLGAVIILNLLPYSGSYSGTLWDGGHTHGSCAEDALTGFPLPLFIRGSTTGEFTNQMSPDFLVGNFLCNIGLVLFFTIIMMRLVLTR